jgi:hypothetical protein
MQSDIKLIEELVIKISNGYRQLKNFLKLDILLVIIFMITEHIKTKRTEPKT